MMDTIRAVRKYIGIPWKAHGRDMKGLDCYGLVVIAMREVFGREVPDFEYAANCREEEAAEIYKHMEGNVRKLGKDEEQLPGDIAIMSFMGEDAHIALYIGFYYLMHATRVAGVRLTALYEMYRGVRTQDRITGWYRWL